MKPSPLFYTFPPTLFRECPSMELLHLRYGSILIEQLSAPNPVEVTLTKDSHSGTIELDPDQFRRFLSLVFHPEAPLDEDHPQVIESIDILELFEDAGMDVGFLVKDSE